MGTIDTGFRKLDLLRKLSRAEQLSFLAEGFPIILSSATSYRTAALQIKNFPREASVLNEFAKEEAAKILILMDVVRCPDSLLDRCLRKICGWFYNHHARLIYADAPSVTGYDVVGLQEEYVDFMRQAYRVDGPGAPIVPQWELWEREATLYADVTRTIADPQLFWHSPFHIYSQGCFISDFEPALEVVCAMDALGFFTERGVEITAKVWRDAYFTKDYGSRSTKSPRHDLLLETNLEYLCNEGWAKENATIDHLETMRRFWQLPMYDLDLSPLPVDPQVLQQENSYW